jgi:hypothetical protein
MWYHCETHRSVKFQQMHPKLSGDTSSKLIIISESLVIKCCTGKEWYTDDHWVNVKTLGTSILKQMHWFLSEERACLGLHFHTKIPFFLVFSKTYKNDVIWQYTTYKIFLNASTLFGNIKNARRGTFYEVTNDHLTVNDMLHISSILIVL